MHKNSFKIHETQKETQLKGELDKFTILVGDFNIPFS